MSETVDTAASAESTALTGAPAAAPTEAPTAAALRLEGLDEPSPKTKESEGGKEETSEIAYTDFKVPEGFDTLDAEILEIATPLFKEAGLNQEQAQKFVDLQAKFIAQQQDRQMEQFQTAKTQWLDSAKTDSEFGGDKFDQSAGQAKLAIDKLGSPGLKQLLDEYGVGNHPEMIRFAWKVGGLLSEDSGVGEAGSPPKPKLDRAERMYPKSQ